jgi:nucleoside-diphosphate-sugar epimerase
VRIAKKNKVKRFIYASSSSVYGIKEEENVTEDLSLEPLTDYSKYKMLCEEILAQEKVPGFTTLTLRPSTVCGYSPRLRLDLTVNILTNHAVNKGKITVFGGKQKRPNIHMEDMVDLYVKILQYPAKLIDGKIYNAGYENFTVMELAQKVKKIIGKDIPIEVTATDDNRSYQVCSEKIKEELGFVAKHTVEEAIEDLCDAFNSGKIPNPDDIRYYNIKTMKALNLK